MIEGIYEVAYGIWNSIITVAMTLFTTSPMAANGAIYETAHTLFRATSDISVPISSLFFGIAMCKDSISSPREQQKERLAANFVRFGIIIGIIINLWEIMGLVIQITDGLSNKWSITGTYTLSMSNELKNVILESSITPEVTISLMTFGADLVTFFSEWVSYIFRNCIFALTAVATLIINVASSISILSAGYLRIIKPLVMIPYASITVAMGAGEGDVSRVTWNYLKTFVGFCLSGSFMVLSVKFGVALSDGLLIFDMNSLNIMGKVLYISIQNAITPIIIAGLVKGTDSLISRFL